MRGLSIDWASPSSRAIPAHYTGACLSGYPATARPPTPVREQTAGIKLPSLPLTYRAIQPRAVAASLENVRASLRSGTVRGRPPSFGTSTKKVGLYRDRRRQI